MKILKPFGAVLIAFIAMTDPTFASGVRGGGDIVDVIVDGKPKKELYDLVSAFTCDWRTGRKMMDENPEYSRILTKIAEHDWYMALEIKRETAALDFCVTNTLLPIFTYLKTSPDKTQRVAFRFGSDVYWDDNDAAKLSPRSRAFLLLHEVLHSYLSMDMPRQIRYLKLRSMVKAFSRVEEGVIRTREDLHFQVDKNDFDLPLATVALDEYRPQLEFILASGSDKAAMVLAAENPEDLINIDLSDSSKLQDLSPWDLNDVYSVSLKNVLAQALQLALIDATLDQFKALMNKPYKWINPVLVALSAEEKLSVEKLAELYDFSRVLNGFSQIYKNLSEIKITTGPTAARRIVGAPELFDLVAEKPEARHVVDMVPLNVDKSNSSQLPIEIQGIVRAAAKWANEGRWGILQETMLNNQEFYDSFGLKSQRTMILGLSPAVAREKALASSVLQEVRESWLQVFIRAVKSQIKKEENVQGFENRIQYQRFEGVNAYAK